MTPQSRKVLDLLQLVRLELLLPTLSGTWVMVLLGYGFEQAQRPGTVAPLPWSLPMTLLLGAIAAGGLHVYGMALNDALDARHDRVFNPQRPVAGGRVSLRSAVSLAVLGLLIGLMGAVLLGLLPAVLCLAAAFGLVFYSAVGKYLPGVGVLTLGLVRIAMMLLAHPQAIYLWPVWLAISHVLVTTSIAHRLEGKRPRLEGGHWWVMVVGWLFVSLLMLGWMRWHEVRSLSVEHFMWLWPTICMSVLALITWRWLREARPMREKRSFGRRYGRLAMAWLVLYDTGWLVGAGLYGWAGAGLGLFVLTLVLAHSLTLARELAQPGPGLKTA